MDRPLDLRLELDVATEKVVVTFAKRLRVPPFARLRAPRLGEIVEPIDQLLRFGEWLDDAPRADLLDEIDVAVVARPEEREHDRIGVLVADRARDRGRREVARVLGDHRVVERARADAVETLAA